MAFFFLRLPLNLLKNKYAGMGLKRGEKNLLCELFYRYVIYVLHLSHTFQNICTEPSGKILYSMGFGLNIMEMMHELA